MGDEGGRRTERIADLRLPAVVARRQRPDAGTTHRTPHDLRHSACVAEADNLIVGETPIRQDLIGVLPRRRRWPAHVTRRL